MVTVQADALPATRSQQSDSQKQKGGDSEKEKEQEQETTSDTPSSSSSGSTPVQLTKKSTKGAVFYKHFQAQLDHHILSNFADYAKPLMSLVPRQPILQRLLLGLLDKHLRAKHHPHHQHGSAAMSSTTVVPVVGTIASRRAFLSQLLPHLDRLSTWTKEDATQQQKEATVELISKILALDVSVVLSSSSAMHFICNVAMSLLHKSVPLSAKNHVLVLLPYLLSKDWPADQKQMASIHLSFTHIHM